MSVGSGLGSGAGSGGNGHLLPDGLELVEPRVLLRAEAVWIGLLPGDRPIVSAGDLVTPGSPLAQRLRATVASVVPASSVAPAGRPGAGWTAESHRSRGRPVGTVGELMFESSGRWHLAVADHTDMVESPVSAIVREVRAGIGILLELAGQAMPGILALGAVTRGRIDIGVDAEGEVRAANLDVGRSGAILVLGSRVDAETLIRARAMGVRGVVVASMAMRDVRDFRASEARLRASLHRPPPFAVLVLDGHVRRPIAGPMMAILSALAGREAAIVIDPPSLAIDGAITMATDTGQQAGKHRVGAGVESREHDGLSPAASGGLGHAVDLPRPPEDSVRVRYGPGAGREGRWVGLAGRRRFAAGVHLEAGLVQFPDADRPSVVALADLERFV